MVEERLTYKPHIDGLRAIAVTLVFLFHLNPEFFSGGYLGVDVFFVISGFVITQTLYKEFLKTGRINIKSFYLRRIKRLYPALVTMVLVTTSLYFFFGFLWNTNVLIKSSLTTLFAVSNLFYLKQITEYFDRELTNPFLHTWSLGIEEQFYLVYPLMLLVFLLLLKRTKFHTQIYGLLLLIGTIGLYLLFALNTDNVWGDFYWPLARFWELLAGCALFFFVYRLRKISYGFIIGLIGLSLVAVLQISMAWYANLHIGSLVAVLAAAMIIYAGLAGGWVEVILAKSPVVFVGKLSYSLYLWHLPVIYFATFYIKGVWHYIFAVVATLALAYLSYRFIETPLRYANWLDKWIIRVGFSFALVMLLLLVIVGPGKIVGVINYNIGSFAEAVKAVNYIESKHQLGDRVQPDYRLTLTPEQGEFNLDKCGDYHYNMPGNEYDIIESCLKDNPGDSLIYITGDSHSYHYLPMLDNTDLTADVYFERYNRASIVGYFGAPDQTDRFIGDRAEQLKKMSEIYDDIYYMSSMYLSTSRNKPDDIEKNLTKYVEALNPYAHIILVAPTPVWPSGPEICVLLEVNCNLNRETDRERRSIVLKIMEKIAATHDDVYIYDPSPIICSTEECLLYDKDKDLLWYDDDDHLSTEGAKLLVPDFENWFEKNFGEGSR